METKCKGGGGNDVEKGGRENGKRFVDCKHKYVNGDRNALGVNLNGCFSIMDIEESKKINLRHNFLCYHQ